MSIRKFQVRDLVITTDVFGARTFVLVSITETGYRAVAMKDKKRYNLTDEQIACRVGVISEDSPLLVDEYYAEKGKDHCLQQAREFPAEAAKWRALANLKPDNTLRLVHRRKIFQDAVFIAVNCKKPLYPIRAKIKGLAHDFRLDAMILEDWFTTNQNQGIID